MLRKLVTTIALTVIWGNAPRMANGQQVTLGTPAQSLSHSFFAHMGTSFQFQQSSRNGFVFFRHPGGGALPPFGGFEPTSQERFAMGGRKGNAAWRLGATTGQGSSVSRTTLAPSLALSNGGFGVFNNAIQRPFVMGFVPVVSSWQRSPMQERLDRLIATRMRASKEIAPTTNTTMGMPRSRDGKKPDDPPLILVER